MKDAAHEAIRLCRELAAFSEAPGKTTRTFLSAPMDDVHRLLGARLRNAGMNVWIDGAGNLRAANSTGPRLIVGSHLDTIPDAGAFDGVLGVVLGVLMAEALVQQPHTLGLEVIGFSEEEGVKFRTPFIGSRAVAGTLSDASARSFGLDPSALPQAKLVPGAIGYLEFHIEQGPVLEDLDYPLAVVDYIVGQSRLELIFSGAASHAGTTPMHARRDALAGAAEWIVQVECDASIHGGLVATVGRIESEPNAPNVVPGLVTLSLDVRHAIDGVRKSAAHRLAGIAEHVASKRRLAVEIATRLDQAAVPMDESLCGRLETALERSGYPPHRISSGAGHDAMIIAPHVPATMLFIRSPGGISHSPLESVNEADVAAALTVGMRFFQDLEQRLA